MEELKEGLKSCVFWGAVTYAGVKIGQRLYKRLNRKSFENKVVLITGGAGELGKHLTERFLRERAVVIIWDIDEENGGKVVMDFQKKFKNDFDDGEVPVFFKKVNILNIEEIKENAQEIENEHGGLDVLINNAGIVSKRTIFTATNEQIKREMGVNILSHFWTVRAFVPQMITRNSGHIVSISSAAGLAGCAGLQVYCASKFAVIGFTESMRLEFGKSGIAIDTLVVCPSTMTGPMFHNAGDHLIPLQDPRNVANKIVDAMKDREIELIVPGYIRYINYGTRIMIPNWADSVQHTLGITKCMDRVIQ